VDGDGRNEFFTTPSEPNRLDGVEQGGRIDMYKWDPASKSYARTEVGRFADRHAKELLVVDYEGKGRAEVFAALEGADPQARVIIRAWAWKDGAFAQTADIPLESNMCRFLNFGDTDGDGVREIIASTRQKGIFVAERERGNWQAVCVVPGSISGGFEHATVVFDWDGDKRDDMFVASDAQKKVRRFWYDPKQQAYTSEDILDLEGEKYFIWNVMPLPAGR
jgi:hypothetical protein